MRVRFPIALFLGMIETSASVIVLLASLSPASQIIPVWVTWIVLGKGLLLIAFSVEAQ